MALKPIESVGLTNIVAGTKKREKNVNNNNFILFSNQMLNTVLLNRKKIEYLPNCYDYFELLLEHFPNEKVPNAS